MGARLQQVIPPSCLLLPGSGGCTWVAFTHPNAPIPWAVEEVGPVRCAQSVEDCLSDDGCGPDLQSCHDTGLPGGYKVALVGYVLLVTLPLVHLVLPPL